MVSGENRVRVRVAISRQCRRTPMPYPASEIISDEEFDDDGTITVQFMPQKDGQESAFVEFLPPFSLDEKYFELTECEVSTVSEMLKRASGWKARTTGDGILTIAESGPGICAVYTVLRDFVGKYPGDNVLRKWALDIIAGAEKVYGECGVPASIQHTFPSIRHWLMSRRSAVSIKLRKESDLYRHRIPGAKEVRSLGCSTSSQ
ncbi:hypothetical protein C8R44DRAFT_723653 [Mycena epipterygia]|nr:hypothetical protein C8R44DRAFT_723653 [Mycena epipterygia]